jgi:glutamine amidotransferase
MSSVAVVDYGMGNLHSISKALQFADAGVDVLVTANPEQILGADRVVFPGVGAIRDCIDALQRLQLSPVITEVAKTKPLLCICIGMQALMSHSDENEGVDCLNIVPGQVQHFPEDQQNDQGQRLKIPHMGWNNVKQRQAHPLWDKIPQDSRFYFVHSYYTQPDDTTVIAASTDYAEPFVSALTRENIFAVQFHPEKSQAVGIQLLHNFLQWHGQN